MLGAMSPSTTLEETQLGNNTVANYDLHARSSTDAGAGVSRYVIVEVDTSSYGFITDATVELRACSEVQLTRVPGSPAYVRGVINHRGSIIPVVDTRVLLGLPTAAEQTARLGATLSDLSREPSELIGSIERAVRAGETPPTPKDHGPLARWCRDVRADPRRLRQLIRLNQSAGTDIEEMARLQRSMHLRIGDVLSVAARGRADEALTAIERLREAELASIERILQTLSDAATEGIRSMMVITEIGERRAAFVVDAIHTVEDCADRGVAPLPDSAGGSRYLRGMFLRPDGSYILICDIERMYEQACPR